MSGGEDRQAGLRGEARHEDRVHRVGTMGATWRPTSKRRATPSSSTTCSKEAAAPHLAAGAVWAATPREVAKDARRDLHLAARPSRGGGGGAGRRRAHQRHDARAAYFDLSTNSPALVRRLHAAFAEKGLHLLDAPVSGGPERRQDAQARAVGRRRRAVFDRFKPVLDAIGDQAYYVGPDRRGLGGQAGPQLRGLRHPDRPRGGLHDGRQGRRRSAHAVPGGAAGCAGPPAHVRRPRSISSCPARSIRPPSR